MSWPDIWAWFSKERDLSVRERPPPPPSSYGGCYSCSSPISYAESPPINNWASSPPSNFKESPPINYVESSSPTNLTLGGCRLASSLLGENIDYYWLLNWRSMSCSPSLRTILENCTTFSPSMPPSTPSFWLICACWAPYPGSLLYDPGFWDWGMGSNIWILVSKMFVACVWLNSWASIAIFADSLF